MCILLAVFPFGCCKSLLLMMDDEQLLLSYKSRKSAKNFSLVSSLLKRVDFLICIVNVHYCGLGFLLKLDMLASALANFF